MSSPKSPANKIIHLNKFHEMLNLDDRIHEEVDANELYLLLAIAKFMRGDFSFPSNKTLCNITGWGLNRVQRVKDQLVENGIIEVVERYNEKGGRTSNGYRVLTDSVSIFVSLKGKGAKTLPHTSKQGTPIPQNGVCPLPQNDVGPIPQNGVGKLSINRLSINNTNQYNNDQIEFDRFWNEYDNKKGKKKCLDKWKRLPKKERELIFAALPAYIESTPNKKYRKHPLTWLNGEHWNDEIESESITTITPQELSQKIYAIEHTNPEVFIQAMRMRRKKEPVEKIIELLNQAA